MGFTQDLGRYMVDLNNVANPFTANYLMSSGHCSAKGASDVPLQTVVLGALYKPRSRHRERVSYYLLQTSSSPFTPLSELMHLFTIRGHNLVVANIYHPHTH